jgi:hypothetical protein
MAHPAKDSSSPWWYGMLLQEGKSGWFPNNYVEEIKRKCLQALYPAIRTSDQRSYITSQPVKHRRPSRIWATRTRSYRSPRATS